MRRSSKTFLYVVYAALVIGLVVIIAIAFTKKTSAPKIATTNNSASQPMATRSTPASSKPASSEASQTSASRSAGSSATGTTTTSPASETTTPAASSSSSGSASAGAGQLTNTGPGNLILVFMVSSLSATTAFWLRLRRKLAAVSTSR